MYSKQFCTQYTGHGRWCGCGFIIIGCVFTVGLFLALPEAAQKAHSKKQKNQNQKTYNHLISFRSGLRKECGHVAYQRPTAFSGCHRSKLNLGQLHVEVTVALLVIFSPASLPPRHCASFLHLSPAHLLLSFLILPSHLCGICCWSEVWEFPDPPFLQILRKLPCKFCLL